MELKPEYCGFHRFTANWCAADTDNTLRGKYVVCLNIGFILDHIHMKVKDKSMKNVCIAKLPRKGKLREGVGREVTDWGVGQELHHLKFQRK